MLMSRVFSLAYAYVMFSCAYVYALVRTGLERYQDPVLWVRLEVFFTSKRYQDPVL